MDDTYYKPAGVIELLGSEEENAGGQKIMIIGGCFDTSDIICYREL